MTIFECGLESYTHTYTKHDIRPRCTKVKQTSNHGAIYLLINGCATRVKIKMTVGTLGSLDGLCIIHTKLLEYIMSIHCLAYKYPIFDLFDLKSMKECKLSHNGHLKPICHDLAKLITKRFIIRTKDNVVNINLTYK
jgi:hypothetical protein